MASRDALPPAVATWVEARQREGLTANVLADALGLRLVEVGGGAAMTEAAAWTAVAAAAAHLRQRRLPREPLPSVRSLDHVVELLRTRSRIVVVSGAGISPAVPDFRAGRDCDEGWQLFGLHNYVADPEPFLAFAKAMYPGRHVPSVGHRFIAELERRGALQRNYSQNIDSLEATAGVTRLVRCYGSFLRGSCMACRASVACDAIKEDIFAGRAPRCAACTHELNLIKPDVAFVSEMRGDEIEASLRADLPRADLLLCIGASGLGGAAGGGAGCTQPVCALPESLARGVPQILISSTPVPGHAWDVELLGECGAVLGHLAARLGWTLEGGGATMVNHVVQVCIPSPSPSPFSHLGIGALRAR